MKTFTKNTNRTKSTFSNLQGIWFNWKKKITEEPPPSLSRRGAGGEVLALTLLFFSFLPISAQVNNNITLTGPTSGEIKARESITLAPDFETINGDFIIAEDIYMAPVLKSTDGGDMNYIFTRTLRKEITDTSMISSLTMNDINQQVQYFDGLGRPIQTIGIGASPLKNDIVAPIVYDQFGREAEKHLPYPVEGSGQYQADAITSQKTWYGTATDTRPIETRPFTEITFENSPLNRVLSQLGPGEAWKTADKTTDFKYETNTATEVILWEVDGTTCKYNNHYAAGELYKNTVTDENSNASTEYKDKQGQVLLKTGEEGTKTYYVYDDFGLLRFVIPPKAVEANGGTNLKSDVLKNLCYYYEYDARKRMTLKKLPGAGAVTMKYDLRDRLIETVDSMQRSRGETSFITYDELNRPIRNGIRYSNNKADTLTYTYYDTYDFVSDNDLGISYTDETGYTTNITDKVKGRVTGTRIRILGEDKYISTVNYYDKYGRVVQTQSINQFGQTDRTTNQYHFWGGIEKTMMRHHFDASNELAIEQKFQYDHTGRLKSTSESVNKKTPVITSQLAYDELGQLQSKKLHAIASGQLQKTDYAYNIRGWLTGINPNFNNDENDIFGLNLFYNDTTYFAALKGALQYNGNIRAMKWRHKNDVETGYAYQGYGFEYDKLNRLISGKHGISNSTGVFPAEYLNRYNEDNLKYDNNGNILNLSRTGGYKDVDNLRFGQMDSLKYKYLPYSNQLMSISDNASVEGYGYNDTNKDTTDFTYDGNGNLILYKDKKIKNIEYNILNLPKKIIFDNADSIIYIYDANGIKHIKKFFEKGKQKNAEYYVGGIIYETDSTEVTAEKLRFVMNAEGRLTRLKNGTFRNEYFLKDHLGNTRVVFGDTLGNGTLAVIQETNYYPFGLAFTGIDLKTDKNKFLYNGKELQVDGDLGMYDYGARFYDPRIGRWHSIDPAIEDSHYDWSPYAYVYDNPLLYLDLFGCDSTKSNQAFVNPPTLTPITPLPAPTVTPTPSPNTPPAAPLILNPITVLAVLYGVLMQGDVEDLKQTEHIAEYRVNQYVKKGDLKGLVEYVAFYNNKNKNDKIVFRYMTAKEGLFLGQEGMLPNVDRNMNLARKYITPDVYLSRGQAKSSLALPNAPEVAGWTFESKIQATKQPAVGWGRVQPAYNEPGGGNEATINQAFPMMGIFVLPK